MHKLPVPSPLIKSPPCIIKPLMICSTVRVLGLIEEKVAWTVKATYPMKNTVFISKGKSILPKFTCAQLSEVFCSLGHDIGKKFHEYPTSRLTANGHICGLEGINLVSRSNFLSLDASLAKKYNWIAWFLRS